jgi:hypothetical protein
MDDLSGWSIGDAIQRHSSAVKHLRRAVGTGTLPKNCAPCSGKSGNAKVHMPAEADGRTPIVIVSTDTVVLTVNSKSSIGRKCALPETSLNREPCSAATGGRHAGEESFQGFDFQKAPAEPLPIPRFRVDSLFWSFLISLASGFFKKL